MFRGTPTAHFEKGALESYPLIQQTFWIDRFIVEEQELRDKSV